MFQSPVYTLDDFSGGFVTDSKRYGKKVPDNISPDCLNVFGGNEFSPVQKRLGYTKVNGSTATDVGNGIYNYRYDVTTQYLVSLWAANFKKMDVVTSAWDGTWDPVTADSNKGTALGNSLTYFSDFKGVCIITQDGQAVPQRYYPGSSVVAMSANLCDLDWEYSHAMVTGDDTSISTGTGAYLKVTFDTGALDDIDVRSLSTIATVVTAINAHTGFAAKGLAYADDNGFLAIISNTRGTTSTCVVVDGTSDTGDAQGEATEVLFSGTTATASTITAGMLAPSGKVSCVWKNHTWIADTSANPDRVYRAANGSYSDWDGTDSGNNDIYTENDVGITAMETLAGNMYAFKKWSVHRFTYLGGTPLLGITPVTTSAVGTSSPRTVREAYVPGEGGVLFFLGTDRRIYKFDGWSAVPVSDTIDKYNGVSNYCCIGDNTTYGINAGQLSKCHAVVYPEKGWYVLYFPLGNDTTAQDAFVYDYENKAFWPMHYGVIFQASCIADNGAGQRKMYTQGTGFAFLQDTGNSDVSGTKITAHWVSKKIGQSFTLAKMKETNLVMKSVACTPTFYWRGDWESSWSTDYSETLTTAKEDQTIGTPRIENLIQYKIYDSSEDAAFELYEINLLGDAVGKGK